MNRISVLAALGVLSATAALADLDCTQERCHDVLFFLKATSSGASCVEYEMYTQAQMVLTDQSYTGAPKNDGLQTRSRVWPDGCGGCLCTDSPNSFSKQCSSGVGTPFLWTGYFDRTFCAED
jgi:hypothetical protein